MRSLDALPARMHTRFASVSASSTRWDDSSRSPPRFLGRTAPCVSWPRWSSAARCPTPSVNWWPLGWSNVGPMVVCSLLGVETRQLLLEHALALAVTALQRQAAALLVSEGATALTVADQGSPVRARATAAPLGRCWRQPSRCWPSTRRKAPISAVKRSRFPTTATRSAASSRQPRSACCTRRAAPTRQGPGRPAGARTSPPRSNELRSCGGIRAVLASGRRVRGREPACARLGRYRRRFPSPPPGRADPQPGHGGAVARGPATARGDGEVNRGRR